VIATAIFFTLTAVGQTGATLDREAEQLSARGAAAADLRAPSAQVARVKAERDARARAEKKIRAALAELGADLSEESLAEIFKAASVEDPHYGSDGSVDLRLVVSTKDIPLKKTHPKKRPRP
jgi:hypothetical protein